MAGGDLALFDEPIAQLALRHGPRADDAQRPLAAVGARRLCAQRLQRVIVQPQPGIEAERGDIGERDTDRFASVKPGKKTLMPGLLQFG